MNKLKNKMKALVLVSLAAVTVITGCSKQVSSEGSIGTQVHHEIIGIDPGAGLMQQATQVINDYDLKDWKLVEGSSAAMTAALDKAYKEKKPIIVTGWTPHWMFAKYELKYLNDPKGVFGKDEQIHTIVRNDLKKDAPSAYTMLDRFEWTPEEMAVVMSAIIDGKNRKKRLPLG